MKNDFVLTEHKKNKIRLQDFPKEELLDTLIHLEKKFTQALGLYFIF